MSKRTNKSPADKPSKPYPDFPLFAHATGRWAKKIKGKHYYFGPWDDPEGALKSFLDKKDDLYAGRRPTVESDGLTVRKLCNHYLTLKSRRRDSGELSNRSFGDYHRVCQRLIGCFGKHRQVTQLRETDFAKLRNEIAKTWGPASLGGEITRVRMVFRFALDAGLIKESIRFGPGFAAPSRAVLRRHRAAKPAKMFEAEEIRTILKVAGPQPPEGMQPHPVMRAMVLLGINCGYGNADIGLLPKSALNPDDGWVEFPRPKTGVSRRCPLWQTTVECLREAIRDRPSPIHPDENPLVFLTTNGQRWYKDKPANPLSAEFRKLLSKADKVLAEKAEKEGAAPPRALYRPGRGFYALRHTFETIGGEAADQVAVDHIMGHERDDMATRYRERISDQRLLKVTELVKEWLFESE